MTRKVTLAGLLLTEIAIMILVILIFRSIEDRFIAGVFAGTLFVLLGISILVAGIRSRGFRRLLVFWVGLLHLFGTALPMLITRIVNSRNRFEQVSIWGLSGPTFHRAAEMVYALLIVVTLFELVRAHFRERRQIA